MSELVLPRPLAHQQPVLDADARFKLWRAGRRTGKSRAAVLAAVAGHGPDRQYAGVMQGGDVVWIAPDYPQSLAIWREEVKPRFAGLSFATINETQRRVDVHGLGSLEIRSAEAIDGVRGRRLDGVILDEAAYFDAEYAWNAVLRPALADRRGWAMFASTTNAGHDGNQEKRVPSFFNVLCERAEQGELGPEWATFHNRTDDNPKIPREEITALRAEYPEGSAIAAQELDAELGVAGGRYFDSCNAEIHLVPRADLPKHLPAHWEYWGAFDWGYAHWAVGGAFCMTPEGAVFLLESTWQRRCQDDALARAQHILYEDAGVPVEAHSVPIYGGEDCWAKVTARGGSGVSTFDVFSQAGLPMLKADTDRANGGRVLRRMLAASDDTRKRGFYLVDTPNNRRVWRQLCDAIPDPNDVNKPMKVDANADGVGGDDGADMTRYGVATRIHLPAEPVQRRRGEDVDVGVSLTTGRPVDPVLERFEREQRQRPQTPGGYRMPTRRNVKAVEV
jgi:hypothetical protein